jgi:DnaJ-class molecular chaperone
MFSYQDYEKSLKVLGIVSRFTSNDLKNSYLKLSKKYHPDMPQGDNEKFKEINEALIGFMIFKLSCYYV